MTTLLDWWIGTWMFHAFNLAGNVALGWLLLKFMLRSDWLQRGGKR